MTQHLSANSSDTAATVVSELDQFHIKQSASATTTLTSYSVHQPTAYTQNNTETYGAIHVFITRIVCLLLPIEVYTLPDHTIPTSQSLDSLGTLYILAST